MRISDWSSDVCSSDLAAFADDDPGHVAAVAQVVDCGARAGLCRGHVRAAASAAARRAAEAGLVYEAADQVRMVDIHAAVDHRHLAALDAQAERVEAGDPVDPASTEEHTSELQALMRNSYAVCSMK